MGILRVALAQQNYTVGDIEGNKQKIITAIEIAKKSSVDIIAFGEMAITGYPPEDLLYKTNFIDRNLKALDEIKKYAQNIVVVVGCVTRDLDIYNSAAILNNNEIVAFYHKQHLPNYDVFDEKRYFQKGQEDLIIETNRVKIGICICEDLWYPNGPITRLSAGGAELIININASPFAKDKNRQKEELLKTRARDNIVDIAYVNIIGGQDELVFDGLSMFIDASGEILTTGKIFEEDMVICDLNLDGVFRKQLKDSRLKFLRNSLDLKNIKYVDISLNNLKSTLVPRKIYQYSQIEQIYLALKRSLFDYINKNGFKKIVVGLSGGIDSALVVAIGVEALGKENVKAVLMSSVYTSNASEKDALQLAKNLDIETMKLPIEDLVLGYQNSLAELFKDSNIDTTEENLQARIRGTLLMALSNKFGWIVVATGNKSELSVGYCTLYGDMVGGFALLKDVPKTVVYKLCEFINRSDEIIPFNILTKAPSAELRDNQRDQDDLPSYEVIDKIIEMYIEDDLSFSEMIQSGISQNDLKKIIRLIDLNEYKRRQAPVGTKITKRAFGKDRRVPITNRFKE